MHKYFSTVRNRWKPYRIANEHFSVHIPYFGVFRYLCGNPSSSGFIPYANEVARPTDEKCHSRLGLIANTDRPPGLKENNLNFQGKKGWKNIEIAFWLPLGWLKSQFCLPEWFLKLKTFSENGCIFRHRKHFYAKTISPDSEVGV